jgi:thioredoxin-like negative regulator of GroEL
MLSQPKMINNKMNIQNKNLVLLIIGWMALTLWCCNSGKSNMENNISDEPQTDDYYLLRNPDKIHQRATEDLSGKVIVITESDFIERITDLDNPKGFQYKGSTPCVVEVYANWCKPCGYLSQVMAEVSPEYKGKVIFYKIDLDRARSVEYYLNVKTIPILLFFKPHEAPSKSVGYLNHNELRKAINDYLLNP